jgi:hypothetical protein
MEVPHAATSAASTYLELAHGKVLIAKLPAKERYELYTEGLKMRVLEGYLSAASSLKADDFWQLVRKVEDEERTKELASVVATNALASGKSKKDEKSKQRVRIGRSMQ